MNCLFYVLIKMCDIVFIPSLYTQLQFMLVAPIVLLCTQAPPIKHETLNQCWGDVVDGEPTLVQCLVVLVVQCPVFARRIHLFQCIKGENKNVDITEPLIAADYVVMAWWRTHDTLYRDLEVMEGQWWINVCPMSITLAQHRPNINKKVIPSNIQC